MKDNPPSTGQPRRVLSALQGLRAIAALSVVIAHARSIYDETVANVPVSALEYLGEAGVLIFFVISGFIMVHVHQRDFGRAGAVKTFLQKRVIRIVPFYTLMTLVYTARLYISGRPPDLADLARSILFIPYANVHEAYGHPLLGVGWTLNYEAAFYIIFGAALFFRRGVLLVTGVIGALFLAGRLNLFPDETWFAFWSQPDIMFFLAGVGIGYARNWFLVGPVLLVALGAAAAIAVAGVWFASMAPSPGHALLVLFPMAVCATVVCIWAREQDRPSALRSAAEIIGDATFAIYLTHGFIISPAAKVVARLVPDMSEWVFIPLALVISVVLGIGVHRIVERPLMRTCRRMIGPQSRGDGAAVQNSGSM